MMLLKAPASRIDVAGRRYEFEQPAFRLFLTPSGDRGLFISVIDLDRDDEQGWLHLPTGLVLRLMERQPFPDHEKPGQILSFADRNRTAFELFVMNVTKEMFVQEGEPCVDSSGNRIYRLRDDLEIVADACPDMEPSMAAVPVLRETDEGVELTFR